ncbi:MAG TPA: hypothetical protein VK850_17105 [Candidatus Binatia bacterium]|nr:hypothetical protein [Candidatus Binatia bacterium]
MKSSEQQTDTNEPKAEQDYGKPLLVEWMDSNWFQVWLKLARHEEVQPA